MVQPPALRDVTHRDVLVGDVRLHIAEAGASKDGPPLLLVHGWPQHWWIWRDVLPRLAEHHHVIAVDLRGHGWSETPAPDGGAYDKRVIAQELLDLCEVLELDRPVLVGHDWGGWVSLLAASLAPQRVRGVVATAILAPWEPIPWRDLWRFGYQLVAGGPWGQLAHRRFKQRFLRLVFKLGAGGGRRLTTDEKKVYLTRYRDPARARAGVAMYRQFLLHELADLRRGRYTTRPPSDLPVLMLPGRDDGVLTPRLVRRAAGPSVEVRTIDGAGHWVPEQRPDALAGQIEEFLTSLAD